MITTIDEMVFKYVNQKEQYVAAHFDEIELSGWQGYEKTDVVPLCLRLFGELRLLPAGSWPKGSIAHIVVPLKAEEKLPGLGVVRGWKYIRDNWDINEPPALYLGPMEDLGLESAVKENYTAPVVGSGDGIDAAYIRYSRDVEQISLGDVYYGCVHLVIYLSPERGSSSFLGRTDGK